MTDKTKYEEKTVTSYQQFYPFYLSQHTKPLTKLFHFIGTSIGFVILSKFFSEIYQDKSMDNANYKLLALIPLCGYFMAWVSHFFIEKNKPATFKYPFWSLRGDLHMWFEILCGKHRILP